MKKPFKHKPKFSGKKEQRKAPVRAKKQLGQHFLIDEDIAEKISKTLSFNGYKYVLEIGPGTGMLTKYLLDKNSELTVMELDRDSIVYLRQQFLSDTPALLNNKKFRIVEADFLQYDLQKLFARQQFAITGNFPYNISTQIVFKMLDYKEQVPEFSGMFQKEVAQRICEKPGSKAYGILSVLVQAFYVAKYLFTVPPEVFSPPPKVESGVLRLTRKKDLALPCSENLFFRVVKAAFQQRRKTLRNSLKSFNLSTELRRDDIFGKRPEQLSVAQFLELVQKLEADVISD